jgi:hypothetical protein
MSLLLFLEIKICLKISATEELRREMPSSPIKSTPNMSRRETNSLTAHATVCLKKNIENETKLNYHVNFETKSISH